MYEHEVHADDDHAPLSRRDLRDVARGLVLLRREVVAIRESQKQAPAWLSRWVGGPRDVAMWLLLAAALLGRGDIQGIVGLLTGWTAGRAPSMVSTPVAPPAPAQESAP